MSNSSSAPTPSPSLLTAHVLSLVSSASPRDARVRAGLGRRDATLARVDGGRDADEDDAHEAAWEALVGHWAGEDGQGGEEEDEDGDRADAEEDSTPYPSLLDYYRPSEPSALSGSAPPPNPAAPAFQPGTVSRPSPDTASHQPAPSPHLSALSTRLSALLPSESLCASLAALLDPGSTLGHARGGSNLEAELVELLGFEADALEVCGQVLGLGEDERRVLGQLVGGERGGGAASTSVAASGSATPIHFQSLAQRQHPVHIHLNAGLHQANCLAGPSQAEADARIEAQLRENAERPLFSGIGVGAALLVAVANVTRRQSIGPDEYVPLPPHSTQKPPRRTPTCTPRRRATGRRATAGGSPSRSGRSGRRTRCVPRRSPAETRRTMLTPDDDDPPRRPLKKSSSPPRRPSLRKRASGSSPCASSGRSRRGVSPWVPLEAVGGRVRGEC